VFYNPIKIDISIFFFVHSIYAMSITTYSGSALSVDLSRNQKISDDAIASGRKDRNGNPVTHGWISTIPQMVALNNFGAYLPSKDMSELISFAKYLFDRNVERYNTYKASLQKSEKTVKTVRATKKVKTVKTTV